MTKTEVLNRLNINQAEMAKAFKVSTSAVAQWPNDEPLPRHRWIELKYKLFPTQLADVPDPEDKADDSTEAA